MIIDLFINGKKIQAETAPDQMLIDFLRGLGYKSMKRGCDTGNCGLCTVWMDEKPVLSCSVPAARAAGHKRVCRKRQQNFLIIWRMKELTSADTAVRV